MGPLGGCHKQSLNPGFSSQKPLLLGCSLDGKVYGSTTVLTQQSSWKTAATTTMLFDHTPAQNTSHHWSSCRNRHPNQPPEPASLDKIGSRKPDRSNHEVLHAHLFSSLEQVREITEEWLRDYNEHRPHMANGKLPPVQNWQQPNPAEMSPIGAST